jgi:2-dehydro-3-deoxyphosphogluconate aldolase/(4S)-4-hydroxy-2-oxoglutarate aldolase
MFTRDETLSLIKEFGVVAIIRMSDSRKVIGIAKALRKGGIRCIEIPMTVPNALELIKNTTYDKNFDFVIGAGTVLDVETARAAILAGAEYIVGPNTNFDVIKVCKRYTKVVIPGAFTPTEILNAWEGGADIVKVFSARSVGPKYFSDLKGPFPQIDLMPTGGVRVDNAGDFIRAGACAVTIGRDLLDKKAIAEGNFDVLTERAKKLVNNIMEIKRED